MIGKNNSILSYAVRNSTFAGKAKGVHKFIFKNTNPLRRLDDDIYSVNIFERILQDGYILVSILACPLFVGST